MILQKLKTDAEAYLGEKVTEAVITVPAYFNDTQRQATKDAGRIAGLDVMRIINEPTASALAYGLDKKKDEKIAVYDLGGGTFDISILELGEGVFEVKATNGDTHLGGDDFDQRVIDWLLAEFKKDQGIDLSQGPAGPPAPQGGRREGEDRAVDRRRRPRSTCRTSRPTPPGPKHLVMTLTRAKLEDLVARPRRARPRARSQAALKDAGLKPADIDEVILVGGMTRMPAVSRGGQGDVRRQGAAQGRQPGRGRGDRRRDPGRRAGRRRQGRPAARRHAAVARHRDARRRHDQAHRAQHDHPDVEVAGLLDGVATTRPQVEIHVLQGERDFAADNKTLGRFILDGIPPAPRGVPQIEVTFDIDANGILDVKAKDRATGKEQQVRITASSMLDKDAVDQMVRDAQEHAEEDKQAARGGRDPQPGRGPHVPGRADAQGPRRQGLVRGQGRGREQGRVAARGAQGLRHRRGPGRHDVARRDAPARLDGRLPGRRVAAEGPGNGSDGSGDGRRRRGARRGRAGGGRRGAERGDGRRRVQGGLGLRDPRRHDGPRTSTRGRFDSATRAKPGLRR